VGEEEEPFLLALSARAGGGDSLSVAGDDLEG
jgi:hypothetical protein